MGVEVNVVAAPLDGLELLTPENLTAANIHPRTLLATDYLNHFNEVIMLMDMLPQLPDCAEDILAWESFGYRHHFEKSGFRDRDLAILAYDNAPGDVRRKFDGVVGELDQQVRLAQYLLKDGDVQDISLREGLSRLANEELRPLISAASAIVNDTEDAAPQSECTECPSAQAAIDALFD